MGTVDMSGYCLDSSFPVSLQRCQIVWQGKALMVRLEVSVFERKKCTNCWFLTEKCVHINEVMNLKNVHELEGL